MSRTASAMAETICPPHIEGRHPMLYFNIQSTEKYSIAMCYLFTPSLNLLHGFVKWLYVFIPFGQSSTWFCLAKILKLVDWFKHSIKSRNAMGKLSLEKVYDE